MNLLLLHLLLQLIQLGLLTRDNYSQLLQIFHGSTMLRYHATKEESQTKCDVTHTGARQLGCVFQDMTPPKSILRKSTDMRKPIQRVKFTKAIARHTKNRDQNPSLGYICPGEPHERSPNDPKFEDRSQEETERQEQGARESSVEAGQTCAKTKGAPKSNILLTFGK